MRHRLTVPVLALLALTGCGVGVEGSAPAADQFDESKPHHHGGGPRPSASASRVIEVKGDQMRFNPEQIKVRNGETIAVRLTSVDLEHDIRVDDIGFHVHADQGKSATAGFIPTKAGTYEFYCSVTGHRAAGMTGELVVTPSASATPTEPATSAQQQDATTISATVAGGKVTTASKRVKVKRGDTVRLTVTSDVSEEIHVHTYDHKLDLQAGKPGTLEFKADIGGVIEVELEKSGTGIVELQVG